MRNMSYNTADTDDSASDEFRLLIPERWVESAVEKVAPECTRERLSDMNAQVDAQVQQEPSPRIVALSLSVFPNARNFEALAQELGETVDGMLDRVAADLRNGLCVLETPFRTKEGSPKIRVTATRWTIVIRPQLAENSRRTLAVVENVATQDIPTRQPMFRPSRVEFCPVWDERTCDPAEIATSYRNGLEELRRHNDSVRDLRDRMSALWERRNNLRAESIASLRRSLPDQAVRVRADLHAQVRRQYSALRVMMDLLYRRSQHERVAVAGTVDSESVARERNDRVVIAVDYSIYSPVLSEDALIEITPPDGSIVRARIQEVISPPKKPILLITDLEWSSTPWSQGTEITVAYVPRFGMWAHQKAIDALLQEDVHGAWPDLARLLCCPDTLAAFDIAQPSRFFCDLDEDRPSLNEKQRQAVAGALSTPHAFCIQGPPGTGKTTVICEIVEQLIAQGERILLVAPTHVAVDEVLRRIGARPGVRPLRLSWDSSRVAEDVQMYTPPRLIDPFLSHLREPKSSRSSQWDAECEQIADVLRLIDHLHEQEAAVAAGEDAAAQASRLLENATLDKDRKEPNLRNTLQGLSARRPQAQSELEERRHAFAEAEQQEAVARQASAWWQKAVSVVGIGTLAEHARRVRTRRRQMQQAQSALSDVHTQYQAATDTLDSLNAAVREAAARQAEASTALAGARAVRAEALLACQASTLLRERYDADGQTLPDANRIVAELQSRMERLRKYKHLETRFFEIIAEADAKDGDRESLRKDLLAVTNLFCCTTTGVAGSPELKDLAFDTLILDEASRVTDSEFLIAATKAKRWILVGDEHQLPPYVEQGDEHFLHALSAIHASDSTGSDLDASVDALAHLWEEDEELHQFRRDSVIQVADRIRQDQWKAVYADPYTDGVSFLRRDADDPTKELLRSMREHLVHSLFERIVSTCSPSMRVQLVEQRRMIEPIAALVRDPIYNCHYRSPDADDLARCGVTPLITPTFPCPVTFLDTSLLGTRARDKLLRNSFVNETEARWIVQACTTMDRELADAGAGVVTVSILSFYKAQARLIRDRLGLNRPGGRSRFTRLRFAVIDAIDRIQGQESDVVFLSFCRTGGRTVGPRFGQWLQDTRRLNVACTRAHRAIVFVGQKDLLGRLCHNEPAIGFYRHLNELFTSTTDVMQVVSQFGGRDMR